MSDWAKHKLVCDKIANNPEKPRKVYLVLSDRGEGQLYAFYKLKKAEKCALENDGDVRRPYGFEEYEDLSKKESLMVMDMFAGNLRAIAMDHPSYLRPISATKDFFVNGKPSEITIVIACCSGCTLWCASVHFGADASQNAEKEAKDRNSTDDKGVTWVVAKIKVSK